MTETHVLVSRDLLADSALTIDVLRSMTETPTPPAPAPQPPPPGPPPQPMPPPAQP